MALNMNSVGIPGDFVGFGVVSGGLGPQKPKGFCATNQSYKPEK